MLCKEDGLHVSSNLPTNMDEGRRLSAYVTHAFRLINKLNKTDQATMRFRKGMQLYIKRIPSHNLILTAFTDRTDSSIMDHIMDKFSQDFVKAL